MQLRQQLLSLAPTIYTLSGIFEECSASDAEAPVAAPDSDSTSSLLPSSSLRTKAKILFSAPPSYHSPASLSYALPPVTSSKHTEVACLGRSNVGKSSLVAALLGGGAGRGKGPLVRTSKRPGCTQTLNLYSLQGHPYFYLVDLPGYGFARAGGGQRETWLEVTLSYLNSRGLDVLRRTLLLIDARHGVMKHDEAAMDLLDEHAVPYQLVLTKVDALKHESEREETLAQVLRLCTQRRHLACWPIVHVTSSRTGEGVEALRECLASLVYQE
ncbi:hypothetical protein NSK_007480 [Nannochloropsis salina CCMP1776]|uniref:EngB-type G domain-containing protein n=1 Tax=Nannochloropsis salina CCMP1776 TaxID=1027361 RepID=A0A4D9CPZ1_9STRA|nr:hypothetical protein NSK_007480 [Nannochloropsis salina CCMP1776]|eukprot:TFJ81190.1 hypothetical protein NSK_007480 [Nannochloropsis salina CCMP1776]